MKGVIALDDTNLLVRAFKPPLPEWYDDFMALDRSKWDKDRFLNYELEEKPKRKIRLGRLELPVADNVPDEDIEAFFTPKAKNDDSPAA
jgi:hypothetical protein